MRNTPVVIIRLWSMVKSRSRLFQPQWSDQSSTYHACAASKLSQQSTILANQPHISKMKYQICKISIFIPEIHTRGMLTLVYSKAERGYTKI